jgi:hypothetical protein
MGIRKGPNVHVLPYHDWRGYKGFVVRLAGSRKILYGPTTQAWAIRSAICMALRRRSEVVIHRPNGQIRDKDSYGNDPRRSRDTKH